MTTLTTAWMLAGVWGSGFLVGAVVASGRRRPTCRELMRERQPTFAELLMPRDGGNIGDTPLVRNEGRTTPPLKPQPSGGRLMHEGQLFGGYQPRPQGGTTPPPREP